MIDPMIDWCLNICSNILKLNAFNERTKEFLIKKDTFFFLIYFHKQKFSIYLQQFQNFTILERNIILEKKEVM